MRKKIKVLLLHLVYRGRGQKTQKLRSQKASRTAARQSQNYPQSHHLQTQESCKIKQAGLLMPRKNVCPGWPSPPRLHQIRCSQTTSPDPTVTCTPAPTPTRNPITPMEGTELGNHLLKPNRNHPLKSNPRAPNMPMEGTRYPEGTEQGKPPSETKSPSPNTQMEGTRCPDLVS